MSDKAYVQCVLAGPEPLPLGSSPSSLPTYFWQGTIFLLPFPMIVMFRRVAPPPLTVLTEPEDVSLNVAASSPTSSHQTFCSVQEPLQWTPSGAGAPRMTFFRTAPSARALVLVLELA